jgi:small subunit ribosomal protein S8
MSDPIADMLTRVRNALHAGHAAVSVPSSKLKVAIAQILKDEGFIEEYETVREDGLPQDVLRMRLKYVGQLRQRRPVISGIERVSKPGRRVYTGRKDIPWVLSGMGVAILSTPKGVMTGQRARKLGVGGEVLCRVW